MEGALLEREREVGRSNALLGDARAGDGRMLAFAGPAGIGKTSLLDALRDRGREAGLGVVSARAANLERDFPFGVARQLFEPVVARASEGQRAEWLAGPAAVAAPLLLEGAIRPFESTDPLFATVNGLYWLAANMAASSPLLVMVDDVHWADPESLRFLGFLARRLEGLPLLLAVTVRSGEPAAADPLVEQLVDDVAGRVVRPQPLSEAAVTTMVGDVLRAGPDPGFTRACHDVTGGNPFLLRELLHSLDEEDIEPVDAQAARVRRLAPPGISRAVLARLARLPAGTRALARAVAVLGGRADLRDAAALAGISEHEAGTAADALVIADVFARSRPLEFVHPVVRSAIYDDLPPIEQAEAHARAARALSEAGRDAAQVATHVLAAEPSGDAWSVERLTEASAWSLARGAPASAAAFLRRALAEPPETDRLRGVLLALGWAETLCHEEQAAIEHLTRALELADEPLERALITRSLGAALLVEERPDEAARLLVDAITDLGEEHRELRLRMEGDVWGLGYLGFGAREIAAGRPAAIEFDPDEPGARPLLGAVAADVLHRSRAEKGAALARRALADGAVLEEEGPDLPPFYVCAGALMLSGDLIEAHRVYEDAMRVASRHGSIRALSLALAHRAVVASHIGWVPSAEADARQYFDLGPQGILVGMPLALAALTWALTQRGDLTAAEEALAAHPDVALTSEHLQFAHLLHSRACLRLRQGRISEGLADLDACRRHDEVYAAETPALCSWRSDAAIALAATGHDDEARRLIAEELPRAATFGARKQLGTVLRAAGVVEGGKRGVELLEMAVEVLEPSPARLDHAEALIDLGGIVRHARRAGEARGPLRAGLALARACGATALAARAHVELESTGARPRKIVRSGVESLTASERRIAEMAASGRTNREIAQELFVTVRTVETHLRHAYQKLDITSRAALSGTLETTTARSSPGGAQATPPAGGSPWIAEAEAEAILSASAAVFSAA